MKEAYGVPKHFHKASLKQIALIDAIVTEYADQGFKLTIRQLYYQLVARGHIPNTVRSYDNTVALMTTARLAGLIDWDRIEDRTRGFIVRSSWENGASILRSAARSYHEDMWAEQDVRVFCVVEKEALAGVLEDTCHSWDVPLLAARGYPSATTLREFAKNRIMGASPLIVVLHLGDHDPSGMDMSRDLEERLNLFSRNQCDIEFKRIALNMDQIEEQKPPPNPAKTTDSRYDEYRSIYGDESWELDALSPKYLGDLLTGHIKKYVDADTWEATKQRIERVRSQISKLAEDFKDPK
jgi:hypothetical protein